jgi:hypothetical protein
MVPYFTNTGLTDGKTYFFNVGAVRTNLRDTWQIVAPDSQPGRINSLLPAIGL